MSRLIDEITDDIIEISDENRNKKALFCDTISFVEIPFS